MTKRAQRNNPESIRTKLVSLLQNFAKELKKKDLRTKVKGLIPACRLLRNLGGSLIPRADASAGRDRILYYLLKYPKAIIKGDELMVVMMSSTVEKGPAQNQSKTLPNYGRRRHRRLHGNLVHRFSLVRPGSDRILNLRPKCAAAFPMRA